MMRVTVEILTHGEELRPRRMVTMNIANVSKGNGPVADYDVEAVLNPNALDEQRVEGRVLGHERGRGYARLVERAMSLLEDATTPRYGLPSGPHHSPKPEGETP